MCITHGGINTGTYVREGGKVEGVQLVPVLWGLSVFRTRRTVSSSVRWSWLLTVMASTSKTCGWRDGWNESRRSGGGGVGECKERNCMVAEQRGSAPCP